MVGKTVGKYRVLERVGRGGMGIVYKAVDETLDRQVAIKVLNAEFGEPGVLKRFRGEAVTLARLNHPGIATIYELHRQDDELMMVMEFVRGETLHQLADRTGPLDPPQVAHLCIQVLDALTHAHRAGVIHRDLKPANLMVTETGSIKVMDFGISRVLGSEHFTLGRLMMGTPAFMAPEQVTGQAIDARADLYAVGVVFYRLLTGRLPFLADTAIAMAQKQVSDVPTPLSELRPDLQAWCVAIVDRALAKDPGQRFQSAEDFRVALASAVVPQSIGELPTLATPMLGTTMTGTGASRPSLLESDAVALPRTNPPRDRTGTTVVLGRTHLFALTALILVLSAGIVMLAIAAFRNASSRQDSGTPASSAAAAETQKPLPPANPAAGAPATAVESRGTTPSTARGAGSGTDLSRATPTAPVPPVKVTPPPPAPPPTGSISKPLPSPPPPPGSSPTAATPAAGQPAGETLPVVAFANVRMLVMTGERLREQRGLLRIGNGEVVMTDGTASRVLTSTGAVTGVQIARSKQP